MRVVFERPRYTKWLVRGAFLVFAGLIAWGALASALPEKKVMVIAVPMILFLPFVVLGWFRTGQRIELDENGITVTGRVRTKRYTWNDVASDYIRYPLHYWNDKEVPTPPELEGVEAAFTLEKPLKTKPTWSPLQRVAYDCFTAFGKTEWVFKLREALTYVRSQDPTGDWRAQMAAVFAARDRDGLGPTRYAALR